MRRQYAVFGDERFERLAGLSNGHLYNLRRSVTYRRRRTVVAKTQATHRPIGHRRKPQPDGQPGYVRVDTVHQGDQDGAKGVYHINAVDKVTQFQFVGTMEAISERFLLPVLEGLIKAFPFVIQGIHADNGSESINHRVAALLNKLRIGTFTQSRPRHCNDNAPRSSRGQALAESKNASVVRKHLGHGHIPRRFAPLVNEFAQHVLSPFLNTHRPQHLALRTPRPAPDQAPTLPRGRTPSHPRRRRRLDHVSGDGTTDSSRCNHWNPKIEIKRMHEARNGWTPILHAPGARVDGADRRTPRSRRRFRRFGTPRSRA